MKQIFGVIICFFILFSSTGNALAQNESLDELLNLDSAVEIIEIRTNQLPQMTFSHSYTQEKYNDFLQMDSKLRNAFLDEYKKGNISYYGIQDIIAAYDVFLYHTEKTFTYLSEKEKWYASKEIDTALSQAYTNIRTSYSQVKQLVENQKKMKEESTTRATNFTTQSSSSNYDSSYYDDYYNRTYYYDDDTGRYYYYKDGEKYSCSRSYSSSYNRYTYSCYEVSSRDVSDDANQYDYSYYDDYYERYYYYNSGSSRYYYYDDGDKYSCSRSYSSSRDRYTYSCSRISGTYYDYDDVEIEISH